jgi:hypothetical protein
MSAHEEHFRQLEDACLRAIISYLDLTIEAAISPTTRLGVDLLLDSLDMEAVLCRLVEFEPHLSLASAIVTTPLDELPTGTRDMTVRELAEFLWPYVEPRGVAGGRLSR